MRRYPLIWILLWPALASAQSQEGVGHGPPTLRVSALQTGVTRFRLVPEAPRPDTTMWTVERRVIDSAGGNTALQVMVVVSHGEKSVDSVLFDHRTLVPIWEHLHGAESAEIDFAGSRLWGRVTTAGSATVVVDLRTPGFAFSSTMDNLVIQSLPLSIGYGVVLPFWDGDHLEMDTVRVRSRDMAARPEHGAVPLRVEFVEPFATETLWIEPTSRHILRHRYVYAQDGARAEVRAGVQ